MPNPSELPGRVNLTRSQLPVLTGMRFIAAAVVVVYHAVMYGGLFTSTHDQGVLATVVDGGGWAALSFFFLLSGFVLTWSARGTDSVPRFWRRRLLRIFPNHIVTAVAAYVLLSVVGGAALPDTAWLNILLLQSWVPDLGVVFTGNVVSWSLSCELLFYLSFPLLLGVLGRIRPQRLWVWTGAVAAAIGLVPALATVIPPAPALAVPGSIPLIDMTMWEQWFVALFPVVRMLEFMLGIMLARIVITGRRLPFGLGGSVALAVAAYALLSLVPGPYRVAAVMALPLGLVIAAGAADQAANERGMLSSRTMVRLGDLSFALYVVHWLVLDYGHQLLGATRTWATPVALAVLVLLFGTALGLAALLHLGVERPIMRRFSGSRRRAHLTVVPAVPPAIPDRPAVTGENRRAA